MIGYGHNPFLFHLGAFCVDTLGTSPGDRLVATRYYNQNNEGFGSLWTQDLSIIGVNAYDDLTGHGARPRQIGSTKITLGVRRRSSPG